MHVLIIEVTKGFTRRDGSMKTYCKSKNGSDKKLVLIFSLTYMSQPSTIVFSVATGLL